MANNLDQAEANRLLAASFGTAYTAPTAPLKLAILSAVGSNTANGTEISGGSYARQTITMGAPSAGTCSNNAAVNFTNMPAVTATGVEVYDSAATPRRQWQGALGASKTVGAGDTLSFAVGAVSASIV